MPQSGSTARPLIGSIIFCIPLSFFMLWIYANIQTTGYPDNVNLFFSYFPGFLRGRFTTTLLSLIACIIAVILNAGSLYHPKPFWRVCSWIVLIGGILMGFLNLFSMM